MSKARLVITAMVVEKRPVAEVVAGYGVSRSWVYELLARYAPRARPRSNRAPAPAHLTGATPAATVELILRLRKQLAESGLDAGADTIGWHLPHHHADQLSRATINRILVRAGAVTPEPAKRPKSSYIRFEAEQPNETWQSDFTHYRLTATDGVPSADVEIITWLDDHSRYALHVTAHARVTGPIVLATFPTAADLHGYPGIHADRQRHGLHRPGSPAAAAARNALEHELRDRDITQKNSRPNHPTTCGKVERFQQTLKKWLRAQPDQPATLAELQALLDEFVEIYNHQPAAPVPAPPRHPRHRLHRPTQSRPQRRPQRRHPRPSPHRQIDKAGCVTLRVAGRLHHIGVGRTHARTHVLLLVQDLARPHHRRRHRRNPPRPDHRPHPRLPGHRPTIRTTPKKMTAEPTNWGPAVRMS